MRTLWLTHAFSNISKKSKHLQTSKNKEILASTLYPMHTQRLASRSLLPPTKVSARLANRKRNEYCHG